MKLHLCCGDVYLDGYINIDIKGKKPPKDNPNLTTLCKYYDKRNVGDKNKIYVDREMDILKYDYPKNSINEVVMISSFEHFTKKEAEDLTKKIYKSLVPNGRFKFDFPDLKATANEYIACDLVRLIYGSYKNEYSIHKWGYTRDTIKTLFNGCNWRMREFGDIVKHDYPMQGVTLTK